MGGRLGIRNEGWRFFQDEVSWSLGHVLRDKFFMYPGIIGLSWGNRGFQAAQTAIVGNRGSMEVPGSWGSTIQVITGMLGVGCNGVELGASHIQEAVKRE